MSLLERNLEALCAWTPRTGALVAAAAIPCDFLKTTGIDGSLTYRRSIDTPPRKVEWLGATSMPATSASPLIESLAVGTNNGLGLAIGTGYEWAAFAAKLSNAQAVFVYEPDPARVRMVLDVCDLTSLLHSGKIILFSGPPDSASDEISTFLTQHAGYEPPVVLHPLPTLTGEDRNPLLTAGEAMVRRLIPERQALVNTLARRLEQVMTSLSDARIAFTITPRYADERPLRNELAGIPELRVDHHSSTSIVARLQMIVDHRPREILSDLFRPQIACVPPTITVETWIPPTVGPAFWERLATPADLAPNDRIIVHNGVHESRLLECGVPKSQIQHRPLHPRPSRQIGDNLLTLRHRIAIIGDLAAVDPTALSIQLPTHLAVYAAAREIIVDEYLTVHINAAPDILRRALVRANVVAGPDGANDPALRAPMLRVIRDMLIPTVPLLTLAENLAAQNLPLRLIGEWTGFDPGSAQNIALEPYPRWQGDLSATENPFHDAAVLLHLSPTGTVSPLLWNAVASGVAVVSPQHPTDAIAGTLPSLLKPNVEFAQPTSQQFLATVKSLLRDADRRTKFVTASRTRAAASGI